MSEYICPYVVGFRINDNQEIIGKIYRGSDAKDKSKLAYNDLRDKGLDCFRAQIKEEHCEG